MAAPLGAAAHRLRLHPNPSITILSITQGPDGFLWLAAADGLYRFDGFHYHKIPGFPFASARLMGATRDGSLWVGSREGLARYRNGRFEVVSDEEVLALAASGEGVFARLRDRIFVRVSLDGTLMRSRSRSSEAYTVSPLLMNWWSRNAKGGKPVSGFGEQG